MSGVADRSRIFETHTDIDVFEFKESDNNRLFMLKKHKQRIYNLCVDFFTHTEWDNKIVSAGEQVVTRCYNIVSKLPQTYVDQHKH